METTETWPDPELRERHHGLGWLAVSAREDPIHIGVTADTAEEAAELYERKRAYWAALGRAEGSQTVVIDG